MIENIPADWRAALAPAIVAPTFGRLVDFVAAERARADTAIYPPESKVFTALRLTPLAAVRAVILGQDPYDEEGQAQGLAFSVPPGVTPPPSLRNILDEWDSDLGLGPATDGYLEPWARHGVLLLNTVMTVRQGTANSHKGRGWERFTDASVRAVAAKESPVPSCSGAGPPKEKQGSSADGTSSSRLRTPRPFQPHVVVRHFAHRGRSADRTLGFPRLDSRRSTGV